MSQIEMMYHHVIVDRARHPRHQRRLQQFDAEVQEINPLCGDRITLRLRCDSSGRLAEIGYEARACAICMASADIMAEIAPGMAAEEADALIAQFLLAIPTRPPTAWEGRLAALAPFSPLRDATSRISCATLPWRGLVRAMKTGAAADA